MEIKNKEHYNVYDLVEVVKILRSPDGCPWDKVQTHQTIRNDFIEEVYEAAEAIDNDDTEHLREELGDVLLQVVFHSVIETEQGRFDLDDVADEVCRKMILRHPHVFGEVKADTTEEVLKNWDKIKMDTKSQTKPSEAMESVSKTLPSLMRSQKLQKKASRAGFDYADIDAVFDDVGRNLETLRNNVRYKESSEYEKNLGRLLFSLAAASRFLNINSEQSLYYACDDFIKQFQVLETQAAQKGIDIQDLDAQTSDRLWNEISKKEKTGGTKNEQS